MGQASGLILFAFMSFAFATWHSRLIAQGTGKKSLAKSDLTQSDSFGPVVDVKAVERFMDSKILEYRILDLGPKYSAFKTGHLPKSLFVDWIKDITSVTESERYNLPTREQFESLMSRCGVKKNTHLVLYDDLNNRIAMRMYLIAKYYGHQHIHILDGGKAAWKKAGYEYSTDKLLVQSTIYRAQPGNQSIVSSADFILKNLDNRKVALIDGRPMEQYSGKSPGKVFHTGVAHKKRGHIPGAYNVVWSDNFRTNGTFRSKKELEWLYHRVYKRNKQVAVVAYCNEGLHAAASWFVLSEILGKKNVTVYDDSMCEWGELRSANGN